MPLNIKSMKSDATFDIKVNTNFYLMIKETTLYVFQSEKDSKIITESLKNIKEKQYNELSPYEKAVYTLSVLISEMERIATITELIDDNSILQPGDEGYIEPSEDSAKPY
jgi:hypothetical protein